jgi:hypothetical protein
VSVSVTVTGVRQGCRLCIGGCEGQNPYVAGECAGDQTDTFDRLYYSALKAAIDTIDEQKQEDSHKASLTSSRLVQMAPPRASCISASDALFVPGSRLATGMNTVLGTLITIFAASQEPFAIVVSRCVAATASAAHA